jgi:hypothetical protein
VKSFRGWTFIWMVDGFLGVSLFLMGFLICLHILFREIFSITSYDILSLVCRSPRSSDGIGGKRGGSVNTENGRSWAATAFISNEGVTILRIELAIETATSELEMKLLVEGNNKKLRYEKAWTIKANLAETEARQDTQLGNAEREGVQ